MIKGRIGALIIKELLTLFRDPKSRMALISPPILQLVIFSFAATLEVKNASLMILNNDSGKHGYELVQRFAGSPMFSKIKFATNKNEIKPAIDEQKAIAAIHIPIDFSQKIEANEPSSMQVILDGRRSNASQIVNGYISQVTLGYAQELQSKKGFVPLALTLDRNWFNENLLYIWFTLPSLVGILGTLIAIIVTSLSIARERELGTFDQLLVSPLMPYEILLGKTIPAIIVGVGESLLIFTAAILGFGVPFTGSFLLLLLSMFAFTMSIVGVGLFISSISKTQQQAFIGTFFFLVPAITLSGYAAPIENMPIWLQHAMSINPLKYYLITLKGLFLKSMPFAEVWTNTWPLLIIGTFTLFLAWHFFSRRLE